MVRRHGRGGLLLSLCCFWVAGGDSGGRRCLAFLTFGPSPVVVSSISGSEPAPIRSGGAEVGQSDPYDQLEIFDSTFGVNEELLTSRRVTELFGCRLKTYTEDFIVLELPAGEAQHLEQAGYTSEAIAPASLDDSVKHPPSLELLQEEVRRWKEALPTPPLDFGYGLTELTHLLGVESAGKIMDWVVRSLTVGQGGQGEDEGTRTAPPKRLDIPCNGLDKDGRKLLHETIRTHFGEAIGTKFVPSKKDEEGNNIGDDLLQFKMGTPARSWPRDLPTYLEFSLYKVGMSHTKAIDTLARLLHVKSSRFSCAGRKDAYAVTGQKVRAWKMRTSQLATIQEELVEEGIVLADPCYRTDSLHLGNTGGNWFSVVLREPLNCAEPYDDSVRVLLAAAAARLGKEGFINFFGPQRFGEGPFHTFEIGKSLLRCRWQSVIEQILAPRAGDSARSAEAKAHWADTKDAVEASKMMPRRQVIEYRLLCAMAEQEQREGESADPLVCIRSLPLDLRKLYLAGYQSLLWNCAASDRAQLGTASAIPGDLVLLDEQDQPLSAWDMQDLLHTRQKSPGRRGKRGAEDGSSGPVYRAWMLDAADAKSGRFSIEHVVMPLPGSEVVYPAHMAGSKMLHRIHRDGVHEPILDFKGPADVRLPGAYRHFWVKPRSVEVVEQGAEKGYCQWLLDLLEESGCRRTTPSSSQKSSGCRVSFSLPPSSYATSFLANIADCSMAGPGAEDAETKSYVSEGGN